MRFLKIDKNNIPLNKKVFLLLAISVFFILGFSEKVSAVVDPRASLVGSQFNVTGLGQVTAKAANIDVFNATNVDGSTSNKDASVVAYTQSFTDSSGNTYTAVSHGYVTQGQIAGAGIGDVIGSGIVTDINALSSWVGGGKLLNYSDAAKQSTTDTVYSNTIYKCTSGPSCPTDNSGIQVTSAVDLKKGIQTSSNSSTITAAQMSQANKNIQTGTQHSDVNSSPAAGSTPVNNGQCWVGAANGFIDIKNCFYQGLYYGLFWPISWVLGVAGWIFNFVFDYTVIHMADGVKNIGAIDIAWKTMRDLANIGFIFILLYLAISTIIGAGEHDVKHTLSKLVVVAIFLNFSLFFTKIIIDATNILAVAFFNAIVVNGGSGGALNTGSSAAGTATGIGDAFMGAFRLQGLFAQGTTSSGQAFAASSQPIAVLVGGSITMLVAIAILLASLGMFIKRYIILILVMIFSPLAFAGMVLHQTEHSIHTWWDFLVKEALFAPIYMIFLWISFTIINDPHFKNAIGYSNTNLTLADSLKATDTGGNPNTPGAAGVLIDFMFVAGLLIASLIAAESLGVAGAGGAMGFAKGVQGALQGGAMFSIGAGFNNSLGRIIRRRVEKTNSNDLYARMAGQKINSHGEVIGKAGFISKWSARAEFAAGKKLASGYEKKLDFEANYQKMRDEEFHDDPSKQAAALIAAGKAGRHSTAMQVQDSAFHHYTPKQKANVMLHMQEQLTKAGINFEDDMAYKRYFTEHGTGRSTEQETREILRQASSGNEFHDSKLKEAINKDEAEFKKTGKAGTEVTKFLQEKGRTQGQALSAIQSNSQGLERLMKADTTGKSKDEFEKALVNFNGGDNFYGAISKDDMIGEEVKAAAGNAVFDKAMLREVVDAMSKNNNAKDDPILKAKLDELISKISVKPEQQEDFEKALRGSVDDKLAAYDKYIRAGHAAAANFAQQTNGARVLVESDAHLDERRKLLKKLDAIFRVQGDSKTDHTVSAKFR